MRPMLLLVAVAAIVCPLCQAMMAPPFFNEMMFNQIITEHRKKYALTIWKKRPPQKGDVVEIWVKGSKTGIGKGMFGSLARPIEMPEPISVPTADGEIQVEGDIFRQQAFVKIDGTDIIDEFELGDLAPVQLSPLESRADTPWGSVRMKRRFDFRVLGSRDELTTMVGSLAEGRLGRVDDIDFLENRIIQVLDDDPGQKRFSISNGQKFFVHQELPARKATMDDVRSYIKGWNVAQLARSGRCLLFIHGRREQHWNDQLVGFVQEERGGVRVRFADVTEAVLPLANVRAVRFVQIQSKLSTVHRHLDGYKGEIVDSMNSQGYVEVMLGFGRRQFVPIGFLRPAYSVHRLFAMNLHKSQQLENPSDDPTIKPIPAFAKNMLASHPFLIGRYFPVFENDENVLYAHNKRLDDDSIRWGLLATDF